MSSDKNEPGVILPDMVITPLELGKIQRELFALDQFLTASTAAKTGGLPFISPALKGIVKDTGLNLLLAEDRSSLTQRLQYSRRTAPTVQISFASDPSKQALRVLVRWFRENGHPNTLIAVGVQPNLAGGCIVRTSTKRFDFSLQKLFKENRQSLTEKL